MRVLSLLATMLLASPLMGQITVNDWIVINGKVNEKVVMVAQDSKEVTWDSDDFPPERSVIVGQTYIVFPIAPGEYRVKQIQWDTKKLVKLKLIVTGGTPVIPVPPPKKPDEPPPPPVISTDKDPDFTNRLAGMYSKDVALGVGDAIRLNQLKVNYQEGYRSFMSSSTNKELMDKQGQLNQKPPLGPAAQHLPAVRAEIGTYVSGKLGSQVNSPPTNAGPVWLQLIDSLDRILTK